MNHSQKTGFEEFCGGKLWDLNLTWNTDHPDFTLCFQRTVLVWVPCFFLWALLLPYARYLIRRPRVVLPHSRLNVAKLVITVVIIFLSTLDLIRGSVEYVNSQNSLPLAIIISPLIRLLTFLLAGLLLIAERKKGLITSGVLFVFYFLNLVAGIFILYSYILRSTQLGHMEDVPRSTTFFLFYSCIWIQIVLYSFSEPLPVQPYQTIKTCPEMQASFMSRITFWWINGLIVLGYRKSLDENDIWDPNPRDLTRNNAPQFVNAWKKELYRCNWVPFQTPRDSAAGQNAARLRIANDSVAVRNDDSESTPLLVGSKESRYGSAEPKTRGKPSAAKRKEPSLVLVLAKVFGPTLLASHACKVVCDLLTFVGPLLQGYMIGYTENLEEEEWKGYLYAALFFLSSIANSIFFHQMFHIGMTLGLRIKACVISIVYTKALTMSNNARKKTTVGEIVNLMSVDAQRLQDVTGYLWTFWSAPLQISLALAMLWRLLGVSVLAGLAVMVLLIPVNAVIATFQRKLQNQQMTLKDQRIKLMNEVLNGIRVLKLYAWELSFQEKIGVIRNLELETLKKYCYIQAASTFFWTCAPFLVTLATFIAYVLSGGILDATKAFTALSLFNILRFPISVLPMMITYLVTASVSIRRLGQYLQNDDIDTNNVSHDASAADPVVIEGGTFAWGIAEDDRTILKNVNLRISERSLTAVVGQVGVGKSSLLSAMLGEMEKLDGHVNVKGSVAYVAQQAWIQNATLRDNILFGEPYDEDRYNRILDACALRPDLEILPAGDATEIGEKGINLSGGQKQRVSMARAVYHDCDIYLMDDPLSAVDSHVGKHIFEQVVGNNGLLKNKTRVLVTHGIQWLPQVDTVVVLSDGEISELGTYAQLVSHDGAFAQFLKTFFLQESSESEDEETDPDVKKLKSEMREKIDSILEDPVNAQTSDMNGHVDLLAAKVSPKHRRRKTTERSSASDSGNPKRQHSVRQQSVKEKPADSDKPVNKDKLIQDEASATGQVKLAVFTAYCKAMGYYLTTIMLFVFLLYQAATVVSSFWLSRWTEDKLLKNTSISNTTEYMDKQYFYLGIYGAFGVAQAVFVLLYSLFSAIANITSSRALHNQMLTNVLRSPMIFFDTTPVGRILNRFSRDIETIDNILPNLIRSVLNTFLGVVSTIVVISYSTPIFLSVVLPLLLLYYFIQRIYIPTSRQLKRIESTTRSPIYVHFSETVTGTGTIRAFNKQVDFMDRSEALVDHNLVQYFGIIASNRWLGIRLEFLGGIVVLATAIFAVLGRGTLSGGIVGLSLSYALQVTSALNWMVRMTTDLETNIVSVERIQEYSETPTEADWHNGKIQPSFGWPTEGRVTFDHYATRYRPGLNLVLDDLCFTTGPAEKIGIVGRTGAGKSSMTLALFRLIEPAGGRIIIDDVDVSLMALYQLRSKLTILPQDPVIFSGTLRMNLDPFERYADEELWQALQHSHLKDFVESLPAGLNYECGEGGQNLSVGQRQLVCLARTLLRKTKILILDEATAAVDLETDDLIQSTIRQEFSDCTVLTIAHRLNTIMDSDRVMVLEGGQLREIDSLSKLLANKNSMFYALAKDAGLAS